MSQQIDPNVKNYNAAIENDPVSPELKDLLTQQAAVTQELSRTPATHPNFATLQVRQTTIAAAITALNKRQSKVVTQ